MGKTGANLEPMPFVRKFGAAAVADPQGTAAIVPLPRKLAFFLLYYHNSPISCSQSGSILTLVLAPAL